MMHVYTDDILGLNAIEVHSESSDIITNMFYIYTYI